MVFQAVGGSLPEVGMVRFIGCGLRFIDALIVATPGNSEQEDYDNAHKHNQQDRGEGEACAFKLLGGLYGETEHG